MNKHLQFIGMMIIQLDDFVFGRRMIGRIHLFRRTNRLINVEL